MRGHPDRGEQKPVNKLLRSRGSCQVRITLLELPRTVALVSLPQITYYFPKSYRPNSNQHLRHFISAVGSLPVLLSLWATMAYGEVSVLCTGSLLKWQSCKHDPGRCLRKLSAETLISFNTRQ